MVMNLLKSFKVIACVVLIAAMLSGCMNTVHLKDLLIVEGMGIETKDDKINVIIQTLKLGAASSTEPPEGNRTYNTEEDGDTIVDAVSNLTQSVSKKLFFGQNKIIVFSREIAEANFKENLDYFLRSPDSRIDVAVCIADKSSKDIIESKENDAGVPCENMVYLLKNGQDAGVSAYVSVSELLNMASDKTSDIYLPILKKEKEKNNVETNGIGLFSNDRLVDVTNDDETMGFLMLSGKIKECMIEFNDEQIGRVGVRISSPKIKKRIDIVDGNINFIVDIDCQIMIDEIEKGIITKLTEQNLESICSKAGGEIKRLCTDGFNACRENNSDALRIGEYLAKDSPESYNKVADEWDTYFKTVNMYISANAHMKKITDNSQLN